MTRDFSPVIKRVLAGVLQVVQNLPLWKLTFVLSIKCVSIFFKKFQLFSCLSIIAFFSIFDPFHLNSADILYGCPFGHFKMLWANNLDTQISIDQALFSDLTFTIHYIVGYFQHYISFQIKVLQLALGAMGMTISFKLTIRQWSITLIQDQNKLAFVGVQPVSKQYCRCIKPALKLEILDN